MSNPNSPSNPATESSTAIDNAILQVMRQHRSIRKFTDAPVPDGHVVEAVRAAQMASTSSNVQAYALLRVRDRASRETLVELTGGQPQVAACGAFFVVMADSRRHAVLTERAGASYTSGLEEFVVGVIDAALFAQNLCLAFESMDYGICYIGGLRNDLAAVDRLLTLPQHLFPLFGLCVGVPDQDPLVRPRLPVEAVLMDDRYLDDAAMITAVEAYDATTRDYFKARSGVDRVWSGGIAQRYIQPRRAHLAEYYASKGANLG